MGGEEGGGVVLGDAQRLVALQLGPGGDQAGASRSRALISRSIWALIPRLGRFGVICVYPSLFTLSGSMA